VARHRDDAGVRAALDELARVAAVLERGQHHGANDRTRQGGGTTGEWASVLREIFGEYRARRACAPGSAPGRVFAKLVERSRAVREKRGTPPKLLVAKPGLDGHSNGAEQIAVAARDAASKWCTRVFASRPRR